LALNQLATFVYDGVLDKLLWRGGGLTARIPYSAKIALANALGYEMWITPPALLNDASVTRLANLIKSTLTTSVYVEYANEIWNFASGFPQTAWAVARGAALGFDSGNNRQLHGYYAKRSREIHGIFTTVWNGATAPGLKRVLAFQAAGNQSQTDTYRLQGADLGAFGYAAAPNRPIDYCDVLSYATYISGPNSAGTDGGYTGSLTALLAAADNYDSGTASLMQSALDWLDDDLRQGTGGGNFTLKVWNDTLYPRWETLANTYSKQVVNYEGGLESNAPSTARLTALSIDTAYSAKIAALYAAYKADYRFKVLTSAQMRQFMAQPHSVCPAWFQPIGTSQWSAHTYDLYSTAYKSWDSMVTRNAGKESFSLSITA
jgi:hypothetical protein